MDKDATYTIAVFRYIHAPYVYFLKTKVPITQQNIAILTFKRVDYFNKYGQARHQRTNKAMIDFTTKHRKLSKDDFAVDSITNDLPVTVAIGLMQTLVTTYENRGFTILNERFIKGVKHA